MCFDSSSSSSQASSTTTKDMRVAGGNSSTNISADNSSITVSDAGAIHDAFGFAAQVSQNAFAGVAASDAATADQVKQALASVQAAWSDAKQGEQKILVGLGVVVVAIVGVAALKKG
jgi:hypothetical protein